MPPDLDQRVRQVSQQNLRNSLARCGAGDTVTTVILSKPPDTKGEHRSFVLPLVYAQTALEFRRQSATAIGFSLLLQLRAACQWKSAWKCCTGN